MANLFKTESLSLICNRKTAVNRAPLESFFDCIDNTKHYIKNHKSQIKTYFKQSVVLWSRDVNNKTIILQKKKKKCSTKNYLVTKNNMSYKQHIKDTIPEQ